MYKRLATTVAVLGLCFGFGAAADAADFYTKAPPPAPAGFSWTGIYVGGNGGVASDNFDTPASNFVQPHTSRGAYGGQAGFNWQWHYLLLGVEGDYDRLNLQASAPCANTAFLCNTDLNHQYSVRGRVGLAVDRALFYATGGQAWTTFNGSTVISSTGATFPGSVARTGLIFGAGAELAVTNNVIVGAEWLHTNYGTVSQTYDTLYPNIHVNDDILRARVSFLLGPSLFNR